MPLTPAETEFFYATWTPLLAFVNERKRLVSKLDAAADPEGAAKVRDALWAEPSLLDEFVRDNPAKLSADGLALAASWRHRCEGSFILYRPLKSHMVVLHDVRPVVVFAVHALRTPFEEMVPWMPCMVTGVLLPFGDRIVFDGLMAVYSVHFGPGLRAQFADAYRAAKGRIATRLGPPQAPTAALATSDAPGAMPRPKKAAKVTEKKPPEEEKALTNPGRCVGCGEAFSKRTIGRHVAGCAALHKPGKGKVGARYRLTVESPRMPEYWLQVEVEETTTLRALDRFLRGIWLECCGHLSAFEIGGERFASSPDREGWGPRESSLNERVSELVDVPAWRYEYDYGTTTELRVRPAGVSTGTAKGVRLLARNLPPVYPCLKCGAPATEICAECRGDDGGFYCAKCVKKHPCDEEMLLPVVNSPRTGECGYTG